MTVLRRSWMARVPAARSYAAMAFKNKPKPSSDTQPAKKSTSQLSAAEKNLEAIEKLKRFNKMHTTTDAWGMEMASLDAEIPFDLRIIFRSLASKPRLTQSKFSDLWCAIKHNTRNWMKNSYSMFVMAKANAFPGRNLQLRVKTLGRIFTVRNNSSDALLAPLRRLALDTYRKVNSSVARGHEHAVKEFTSGAFQEKTIKAMRQRKKDQMWAWSITSDVSDAALFPKSKKRRDSTPVDIVSIRAHEIYTENADPVNGHRLLIQALVKFETTQKIDVIDKRGRALNSDLTGSRKVVQYLLLEKFGWYDTPWRIKDQFYKG